MTMLLELSCVVFCFQAEDGIRDHCVTGVQTCALPISLIKPAIAPTIERGEMKEIHGIIVHQTGGSTAQSSIDSYKNPSANGAHFLIEKDGTIYQNRFPLQTNMAHWQNKSALFTGKAMHTS